VIVPPGRHHVVCATILWCAKDASHDCTNRVFLQKILGPSLHAPEVVGAVSPGVDRGAAD